MSSGFKGGDENINRNGRPKGSKNKAIEKEGTCLKYFFKHISSSFYKISSPMNVCVPHSFTQYMTFILFALSK